MKKNYYLVATVIVVSGISVIGLSNSQASSIVDELQKSNLELLKQADNPHVLITKCRIGPDYANNDYPIYHKCDVRTFISYSGINLRCVVAYSDKTTEVMPQDCYLLR